MKKLVILLTLALVLAFAAPVFANPFSDVPADHWAYDAINKLADDGVVKGNADGTFTGKKAMTRYEMATLVARAMAVAEANDEKVTAEDKAMIEKLQAEFSSELNALGVRVAALENKVGNVKITGDARIRFRDEEAKTNGDKIYSDKHAAIRVRLVADAQINDKFSAVARLRADNYRLDDSEDGDSQNIDVDNFYVKYANNGTTAMVGRMDLALGKGTIIDDTIKGAIVAAPTGSLTTTLAYGYLDGDVVGARTHQDELGFVINDKVTLAALQVDGIKLGQKATLGLDYGVLTNKDDKTFFAGEDQAKVYGLNLDYAFDNKYSLFGEYVKSDIADDNQKAYMVGLNVKEIAKKTNLKVSYAKLGVNSVVPGLYTFDDAYAGALAATVDINGDVRANETKLWDVRIDHALAKNTNLYLEYQNAKTDSDTASDPEGKFTRLESGLEFKF